MELLSEAESKTRSAEASAASAEHAHRSARAEADGASARAKATASQQPPLSSLSSIAAVDSAAATALAPAAPASVAAPAPSAAVSTHPDLGWGCVRPSEPAESSTARSRRSRSARVNGAGVDDEDAADAPSAAIAGAPRARREEDIAPRLAGPTAADASRDFRWVSSLCGATTPRATGPATARIEPRQLRTRDAVCEGGKIHRATPRTPPCGRALGLSD